MPQEPENLRDFKSLVEVVKSLRGPDGCPWDKEQTHQTLTQFAIEEAHELAEAIDQANRDDIVEELGDLLLQVVLNAEIGRQNGSFDIHDVIESINKKMIRRHPHVFSDTKVTGTEEVWQNWDKIKAQEKKKPKGFNIPPHLPALIYSQKIGIKSEKMNFDWANVSDVIAKVEEELSELKEAISQKTIHDQQEELGDLLFSVVQVARHLQFDAEQALRKTNQKFERRFQHMQLLAEQQGLNFAKLSQAKLEELWLAAKKQTKSV